MKLESSDIDALRPIISETVRQTLEAMDGHNALLGTERLGFGEAAASEILGVKRHVLRDARLRGEISAKLVGRKYIYSRQCLLSYLSKER